MIQREVDVETGMTVYSEDGSKLGTVAEVWLGVPEEQPAVAGAPTASPPSSAAGTPPATSGESITGYFKVEQGGLLGIGGKELFVPFGAVRDLDPGVCLTLRYAKDESMRLFSEEPAFMRERSS